MNARSSFSSNPTFLALRSRSALALALAVPMLAATWGCGSSAPELHNYSCVCSVADANADMTTQTFSYCGDATDDSSEVSDVETATEWAQGACTGKNPKDTCNCDCTDLGTTCKTPTG
jgi:hypothetical protein